MFEQPQANDILIHADSIGHFRLFPDGDDNPQLIGDDDAYIYGYKQNKVFVNKHS